MENSRIDFFDGIRGWGAIMVLLSHLCGTIPHMSFLRSTPLAVVTDGFLAVYIFFILSGVVLSLSCFKYENLYFVASLLLKRLPRLAIPIFASSIFIYIIMTSALMYNKGLNNPWLSEFYSFDPSLVKVIRFSFYDVFFNYVHDASYNVVLWTMSTELHGSILVAIVLLCLNYVRFKLLFLISVSVVLFAVKPQLACFSIGMIISYILCNKSDILFLLKKRNIKIFLCLLFLLVYKAVDMGRCNVISAAIVVLLPFMFEGVYTFLVSRISSFLGKISFPLYIVHFPILCSFTSYLLIHFGNSYPALWAITFASIALSIFAAFLLLPVEKFAIKISRSFANCVLVQKN